MDRLDTALGQEPAPRSTGVLEVTDGHAIYWEACGRPDGVPVVMLHGGPGGQIKPYYRRLFDPDTFNAIFFDQRGCGSSTPRGSLEANTTRHLIADMEALRQSLGIDRWIVAGGSWGSCLAVAYAEAHPESCLGVVVSGITLMDEEDLAWWWKGARALYPEVWQVFHDFLPENERDDLRGNVIRRILDDDPVVHGPAAIALLRYELQLLDVWPDPSLTANLDADEATMIYSRIFAHYDKHNAFFTPGQLLKDAHRLADVPGTIIAGRFDGVTPPRAAFDLHRAWAGSELIITPVAGHRWSDPLLTRDLVRALNDMAARVAETG